MKIVHPSRVVPSGPHHVTGIRKDLPCQNCGAKAGEECKHDYGCIDTGKQ